MQAFFCKSQEDLSIKGKWRTCLKPKEKLNIGAEIVATKCPAQLLHDSNQAKYFNLNLAENCTFLETMLYYQQRRRGKIGKISQFLNNWAVRHRTVSPLRQYTECLSRIRDIRTYLFSYMYVLQEYKKQELHFKWSQTKPTYSTKSRIIVAQWLFSFQAGERRTDSIQPIVRQISHFI